MDVAQSILANLDARYPCAGMTTSALVCRDAVQNRCEREVKINRRTALGLIAFGGTAALVGTRFGFMGRRVNGKPPLLHESGWKDTVALVMIRFEQFRGRYMLHCHNLEHEDHMMMSRFDVV